MQAYIVSGLVLGSIYAISALGLVLTYTSSRVFNFAHGGIAWSIAIFDYWLVREQGWSEAPAGLVSVFVVAPLLGLVLWALLFRRLTNSSPTVRLVSTIGLWVALPALTKLVFTFTREQLFDPPGFLAGPPAIHQVLGVTFNDNQAAVIIGAVTIAVATTVMLRFTALGLETRATVDSPPNAAAAGVNTSLVTANSWMVGTMLAGLAGVLLAPIVGIEEYQFTLLLVASFAAAVVGKLTSLPRTFVGALAIGLAQGIWVKYQPDSGFFSKGVNVSIPFVVMLLVLLFSSGLQREQFAVDVRASAPVDDVPPIRVPPGWRRFLGPALLALALVSVPLWLDGFWVGIVSQGMALAIVYLSITVVTGEGGMISLCQITLAGIGGFAAARLATESGWDPLLAVLAGAVIAVPCGLLVAGISLRLGDLYLALATIAFALLVQNLVFSKDEFDNFGAGVAMPRPFGIGLFERNPWWFVLVAAWLLVALLVVNLRRSTTGLVLASVRASPAAASTIGISVTRAKLVAFAFSAFVAGLGGAFYAATIGRATVNSFSVLLGVVWLAIVVTWGVRSVLGALLAGIILAVVPQKLSILLVLVLLGTVVALIATLALSGRLRTFGGAVAALVAGAVGVVGTVLLLKVEFSDSWVEVPTLLFGLGAIQLAREPRGVIHHAVHRVRHRAATVRAERAARSAAPTGTAPDQEVVAA